MNMKKELLTDRLRLIPVESRDGDEIFLLLRNDKIKKYLCDNKDIEQNVSRSMVSNSEILFKEKGIGLWLIRDLRNDSTMGFCGFLKNKQLELIYVIHPDFQNNGFATEATLRIIEHFKQLKINEDIYAKVDLPNTESHIVANKIGMNGIGMAKNLATGGDMRLYRL